MPHPVVFFALPVFLVLGGLPELAVDPDVADDEHEEGDDAGHNDLVVHAAEDGCRRFTLCFALNKDRCRYSMIEVVSIEWPLSISNSCSHLVDTVNK